MSTALIYFDGASRNNPGPAGAGAVIEFENGRQYALHQPLGRKTNNQAEYAAILLALEKLVSLVDDYPSLSMVIIRGDSQLVIKQLKGEWKLKSNNLKPYFAKIKTILHSLQDDGINFRFEHIPRDKNSRADQLANEGADAN